MAEAIIRAVGPRIVLGLPLGLGKANTVANALYHRVAGDPSLNLHIFTALTLEAPRPKTDLETRFLEPVIKRTMGGSPPLAYAVALRAGTLPRNIVVNEFFFLAGRWLSVAAAQQSYVSANYTHAVGFLIDRGVNVIAQLVARKSVSGATRLSLSCNTDLTLDFLSARRLGRARFLLAAEVNAELPFMPGDGDLPEEEFSDILDDGNGGFALFAPPKEPVGLREHAIGIHIATTVADGGSLQLGIGEESDATVHALILRQQNNVRFRQAAAALAAGQERISCELSPFDAGLYGVSEMFVDGFLALRQAGILKREIDGAVLHAAFFIGTRAFYRTLREMPEHELASLQMKAVSFTNEIGEDNTKRVHRLNARFINSTMMVTLLGAAVSDGLEDGRVVSGVGGQYNFVTQAFALAGARSILSFKSTRGTGKAEKSNIRFSYPYETIPRHLRDVFVSEYGIADVRGKSDAEIVAALLAIADSRFQPGLLKAAKDAGKISAAYEIPSCYRDNTPERISKALKPLREEGLLPSFPLGTDFDATELDLVDPLQRLSQAGAAELARYLVKGFLRSPPASREAEMLKRMSLARPATVAERLYRALLRGAVAAGVTYP